MKHVTDGNGTLIEGQSHPAAYGAKRWLAAYLDKDLLRTQSLQDSFASVGMSGNQNAEICSETLRRILSGQPVSDRYLLGLAWTIRNMDEAS